MLTSVLRPNFFAALVTVLTGFHCGLEHSTYIAMDNNINFDGTFK